MKPNPQHKPERRTDPQALELISAARKKYAYAPIGKWVTDFDPYMGIGFTGIGVMGNTIEFFPDGTGKIESWGMESASLNFKWRNIGERTLACTIDFAEEDDDAPEGNDDFEMILEYDFLMLKDFSASPYLFEIGGNGEQWFMDSFYGPLSAALP